MSGSLSVAGIYRLVGERLSLLLVQTSVREICYSPGNSKLHGVSQVVKRDRVGIVKQLRDHNYHYSLVLIMNFTAFSVYHRVPIG